MASEILMHRKWKTMRSRPRPFADDVDLVRVRLDVRHPALTSLACQAKDVTCISRSCQLRERKRPHTTSPQKQIEMRIRKKKIAQAARARDLCQLYSRTENTVPYATPTYPRTIVWGQGARRRRRGAKPRRLPGGHEQRPAAPKCTVTSFYTSALCVI